MESTLTPPMKPINLFMPTRAREAESKVAHQHEVMQPAAQREPEPVNTIPTPQNMVVEEPVRMPEPQQFSEADQIISQIFQMLNGLYSIRRRECEGAMQLRAQLDIEHINSSQLRSLLDLERCAKESIQNELGLSIKSTQALSERYSSRVRNYVSNIMRVGSHSCSRRSCSNRRKECSWRPRRTRSLRRSPA